MSNFGNLKKHFVVCAQDVINNKNTDLMPIVVDFYLDLLQFFSSTKGRKGNEIYFLPVMLIFKISQKNRSAICICACLASGRLVKNWQSKVKGRVFNENGIFCYFYGQSAHFICLFGFGLLVILSATFVLPQTTIVNVE